MSKKRRMVLKTLLVSIIVLMFVGTYSFFTADLSGNIFGNNLVQKTGTLRIEYIEGQNIDADDVLPGWSSTKTFTIKNTGTLPVNYDIVFTDLINTFINDEVLFSGTCTSNQSTCESINQDVVNDADFTLKENISIQPNEEHSYEIIIEFIETADIQNYNIGAKLSGKITVTEAGNKDLETISNIKLSGGSEHTLGIDKEGNLYAWGWNGSGQLGDGTSTDRHTPTPIMSGTKFKSIAAGGYHSLGIDEEGNLYAWGWNGYGQLGDGTGTDRHTPTPIMSGTKFKSISAGWYHSLAIDEDGNLYSWGYNGDGQLGDGTRDSENTPVHIMNDTKFKSISAGGRHSLAIDMAGNLYAWGIFAIRTFDEDWEPLDYDSELTPTVIMNGTKIKSISAGYSHSLAIDEEENLYAWGYNEEGQLGDGTWKEKTIPVHIMRGTKFKLTIAGDWHSLAVDEEGNLYAWGYNYYGQLGDGTNENKNIPTPIMSDTKFLSISAGHSHSLAIDEEENLYAWGYNEDGQLGDGTDDDRNTPVIITLEK